MMILLTHAKEIVFEMGDDSCTEVSRGSAPEKRGTMNSPYFYRAPVIKSEGRIFKDSLLVNIVSLDGGMMLFGYASRTHDDGRILPQTILHSMKAQRSMLNVVIRKERAEQRRRLFINAPIIGTWYCIQLR
jgi:hypothetical protein